MTSVPSRSLALCPVSVVVCRSVRRRLQSSSTSRSPPCVTTWDVERGQERGHERSTRVPPSTLRPRPSSYSTSRTSPISRLARRPVLVSTVRETTSTRRRDNDGRRRRGDRDVRTEPSSDSSTSRSRDTHVSVVFRLDVSTSPLTEGARGASSDSAISGYTGVVERVGSAVRLPLCVPPGLARPMIGDILTSRNSR